MDFDPTISFIKRKFREYYESAELQLPGRFGKREWGFFHFGGRGMQRPVAFKTQAEVRSFLASKTPAHAYHSTAYYEDPQVPMADKVWLGADLIFDLDADHIPGAESLSYAEQLAAVKVEFIRLIDEFLAGDFGFDFDDIHITFSGGRGYHAHIRNPKVLGLTNYERREIVDYITGKELDWDWVFPKEAFGRTRDGHFGKVLYRMGMPKKGAPGWKGRIREGVEALLDEIGAMEKKEAISRLALIKDVGEGTSKGLYKNLFEGKPGTRGVDRIRQEDNMEVFSTDKHLNTFLNIVKSRVNVKLEMKKDAKGDGAGAGDGPEGEKTAFDTPMLVGETDEPVTSDIKRLIRMATSLHGKTALRVVPLARDELDDFDPLRDAIPSVFTDRPLTVEVVRPTEMTLGGEHFSLKEGPTELPERAAMFFLCRKVAVLR